MNKVFITITLQNESEEGVKEYNHEYGSNYTPGDTNSILNSINYLNGKTKRIEEGIECLNRLCEDGEIFEIRGRTSVISTRITFAREDSTIIDEFTINNLKELETVDHIMHSFNFT